MSNQVETLVEVHLTNRNRQTVFFRGILAAPTVFLLYSFTSLGTWHWLYSAPIVVAPVVLALVVSNKYPSYILTFNHAIMELSTRVICYLLLLTDDYPSIERNPDIAVLFPDVEGGAKLNRWLPLVKWLMAIPLYFVGILYGIYGAILTVYAWIVTSATGNYPEYVARVVLGIIEFANRVDGYAFALVTDEYPSFRLM